MKFYLSGGGPVFLKHDLEMKVVNTIKLAHMVLRFKKRHLPYIEICYFIILNIQGVPKKVCNFLNGYHLGQEASIDLKF